MEPTPLANLLKELKRTTDRKRYQEIMAQIEAIKIEHELAENAKQLQAEAEVQAEFEAEKEAHLAQVEDLEIKKRFLANNERSMIEHMISGLTLTKLQVETYAEAKKLAKSLNDVREIYGTPEQTVEEIDLFGADLEWKHVANGLMERAGDLIAWNEKHPDHSLTITPKHIKVHQLKWDKLIAGYEKKDQVDEVEE